MKALAQRFAISCERLAALVGLAHLALAMLAGIRHPGLGYAPDLVANWLYYQRWLAGDQSLARLWYFPAPKLLLVALLGPVADTAGVVLVTACAAALLAASVTYLVARAFGRTAGFAAGALLALDPMLSRLVATGGADLFLAAATASAVAAWTSGWPRAAALAVLLGVLTKPTGAAIALPILLDRSASRSSRAAVGGAAALGLALTWLGFAALLGSAGTANRFLAAYARLRGGVEPLQDWLLSYLRSDLGADLLAHSWPLALLGLLTTLRSRGAASLRRLVATAAALAAAYIVLALATRTMLQERFLWPAEVSAIALAVVGAFSAPLLVPAVRPALRWSMTAVCLLLVAADLGVSGTGKAGQYSLLYGHAARAAVPMIDIVGAQLRPGDSVNVPLWFQPLAIWRLGLGSSPERIEPAEVLAVRPAAAGDQAAWVLYLPFYYATPDTAQMMADLVRCDFDELEAVAVPRVELMRRDARRGCRERPAPARQQQASAASPGRAPLASPEQN